MGGRDGWGMGGAGAGGRGHADLPPSSEQPGSPSGGVLVRQQPTFSSSSHLEWGEGEGVCVCGFFFFFFVEGEGAGTGETTRGGPSKLSPAEGHITAAAVEVRPSES
jgi:hypothetical protein